MNQESFPDGGPAFPCDPFKASVPGHVSVAKRLAEGMTLRDYFAARAMQALMAIDYDTPCDGCAIDAYAMADAMLKARGE